MHREGEMLGAVQSGFVLKSERLAMRFLMTGDKAFSLSNNGSNPVMPFVTEGWGSGGGVQFAEVTGVNTVNVTAIDKTGNAVHSRHSVGSSGRLIPSQYYGKCHRDPGG